MNGWRAKEWLRAFLQPVTYLALVVLGFLVVALPVLIERDRANSEAEARRHVQNLAQTFEQSLSRALTGADQTMQLLRRAFATDPDNAMLLHWAGAELFKEQLLSQFTVVGTDGRIRQSSVGAHARNIDLSDRPHIRIHRESLADRLVISEPMTARSSDRYAIFLTRRLTAIDGSYAGVLSTSFDIVHLARSISDLSLGRDGLLALIGLDGIVRMRVVDGAVDWPRIGQEKEMTGGLEAAKKSRHDTFWSSLGPGSDPQKRLIAYRVLDGFPLVAMVGMTEQEVYSQHLARAHTYIATSAILALAILIAMILGAARERRLMAATADLQRRNFEFDAALDNMPHGLAMHDAAGRLRVCNDTYVSMYRLEPQEARPGAPFGSMIDALIARGMLPAEAKEFIRKRVTERRPYRNDVELPDGRIMVVSHQPMADGGWVAVHEDVTEKMRAEKEIRHLAHFDPLTDLANRVLFRQRVEEAIARLTAAGERFNILFLDLDHFKAVNDSLGHATGDLLVRQLAERLKASVGAGDLVARLGGDEFAVLQVAGRRPAEAAAALAGRLLAEVRKPFELDGRQALIETSIGIVLAPRDGVDPDQLLRNVDLALYSAKAAGRNGYRFFEPHMSAEARDRFDLEIDLRNAIVNHEFELHFQPVIDAATRRVCAAEALVRWSRGPRGFVMPDVFIPIAESTGLIVPIGEWILREACRQAAVWPGHIRVAVNLSAVQFRRGDVVGAVEAALSESGLAASRLELEITESVLLERDDANAETLHALNRLGASIVLDDFGTGYSSLSYLRAFPFDKIKIDRSFVRDMPTHRDAATIVAAITGLARSLDITITAEGVETAEQFALLRAVGCHQVQGYYFGRPVAAAELALEVEHRLPELAASA